MKKMTPHEKFAELLKKYVAPRCNNVVDTKTVDDGHGGVKTSDVTAIQKLYEFLAGNSSKTAPSTTKYNGSWDGGWEEHSLNVFSNLCNLIRLDELGMLDGTKRTYDMSSVALVSLLHDISKLGTMEPCVSRKCRKNADGSDYTDERGNKEWYDAPGFRYIPKPETVIAASAGAHSVCILQKLGIKLTDAEAEAISAVKGLRDDTAANGKPYIDMIHDKSRLAYLLFLAEDMSAHLDNEQVDDEGKRIKPAYTYTDESDLPAEKNWTNQLAGSGKTTVSTQPAAVAVETAPAEESPEVENGLNDALKAAYTVKVNFGKYTGKTLSEIAAENIGYIRYIVETVTPRANNKKILDAAKLILSAQATVK